MWHLLEPTVLVSHIASPRHIGHMRVSSHSNSRSAVLNSWPETTQALWHGGSSPRARVCRSNALGRSHAGQAWEGGKGTCSVAMLMD
eukprot:366178-Chlamydomonas_euryale.AAC.12